MLRHGRASKLGIQCAVPVHFPTSSVTNIERRAADVVILGNSIIASSTAYSLAKKGKKVVHIPNLGVSVPAFATPQTFQPLSLLHPVPEIAHLSQEAAKYWRGLHATVGRNSTILRTSPSILTGVGGSGSTTGEVLQQVIESCKEVKVKLAPLKIDEVPALFPMLSLPPNCTAILQADGCVLNMFDAMSAISSLAERQGVLFRDRLTLAGWRDDGDYFTVRAVNPMLPDVESVFEAEQIMVAPGSWLTANSALFKLGYEGVKMREVQHTGCPIATDSERLPIWTHLGSGALPELRNQPYEWGFSASVGALGTKSLSLDCLESTLVESEWKWAQSVDRKSIQQCHASLSSMTRDFGPRPDKPKSAVQTQTGDGLPLVGFHPGFQEGRFVIASASRTSSKYDLLTTSGSQLSPVIAKCAVDLLLVQPMEEMEPEKLALTRDAVKAHTIENLIDTWDKLHAMQDGSYLRNPEEEEELAEKLREEEKSKNM